MDSERGDAASPTTAGLYADDTCAAGPDAPDPRAAGPDAPDPRAALCTVLLDGRFWTAGELARSAAVSTSMASAQLTRLVASGMLEAVSQGPHRYFRLAGPEAVTAAQAQAVLAPARTVRRPRPSPASLALQDGRTCYSHLAGRLGVALTDALVDTGVITADFGLGDVSVLAPLGVSMQPTGSRPAVRPCVDWTQRRYHAAGALPAAITSRLLALDWLRRPDHGRAIRLTEAGQRGLDDLLHTSVCDPAVRQTA